MKNHNDTLRDLRSANDRFQRGLKALAKDDHMRAAFSLAEAFEAMAQSIADLSERVAHLEQEKKQ